MYVCAYASCATYHTLSMPSIHQTMNTTWCSMRALTVRRHCDMCIKYRTAVLSQPFFIICISDPRPITVSMVQSRSASITINGSGEVYSCTLNNQRVNITSGQTVQLTGLTQRRRYTVNCYSVNGSCLEATTRFTTSMAHLPIVIYIQHTPSVKWYMRFLFCRTKARHRQRSKEGVSIRQWEW